MSVDFDLVVAGSGLAGLTTALVAARGGREVLVLEKADQFGGATAVSGGGLWIPNCQPILDAGHQSKTKEVMGYLRRLSGGRTDPSTLEEFLATGPRAVDYLDENTPLRFQYVEGFPDYHPEWDGGTRRGRMIEPERIQIDGESLDVDMKHIRRRYYFPFPSTLKEWVDCGGPAVFALKADFEELRERKNNRFLTQGEALVAGLIHACRKAGVRFRRSSPARRLLCEGGEVRGVRAVLDGELRDVHSRAVMLAAGGIDWDPELTDHFLAGPLEGPAGPPGIEGDGLQMGMEAGARLRNMNEAWWFPTASVPGETWGDGSPIHRLVFPERTLPGSMMVNEQGRRFVNESTNYNDLGKVFGEFDTATYEYRNVPAFSIMDGSFRSRYPLLTLMPGDEDPDWLARGESPEELAGILGIDAGNLVETIKTFNEHARNGEDPHYHRGESAYDRFYGDPEAAHPSLAPLDTPPYYGIEVKPGALGTKGGLSITPDGEVQHVHGEPIPGLYAGGNNTANPMGIGYPGGGGTLGPILAFAYRAGKTILKNQEPT